MSKTTLIVLSTLLAGVSTISGCSGGGICDEPYQCPQPGTVVNCTAWQDPPSACQNSQCICWLALNCDVTIIERPFSCGLDCIDEDLEPNDYPEMAVTLPCGDDAVRSDPSEYFSRCPARDGANNGFTAVEICMDRDIDFYRIYLLSDETAVIEVLFSYDGAQQGDLDLRAWRWDANADDWVEVARSTTETENETATIATTASSGNPEGWYVLEVYGKTATEANTYTILYTLSTNAP